MIPENQLVSIQELSVKYIILYLILLTIISCSGGNKHLSNKYSENKNLSTIKASKPPEIVPFFQEKKTPDYFNIISKHKIFHRPKKIIGTIPKQAFEALEKSKFFQSYSITPNDYDKKHLHGHGIRAQINITDKKNLLQITNHLNYSIDKSNGATATCFNPHHAIRVKYQGITWDWVICFQCTEALVYKSGYMHPYVVSLTQSSEFFNSITTKYNLGDPFAEEAKCR